MIHEASAVLKLVKDNEAQPQALVRAAQCRHGSFIYFPHDFYLGGAMERYGEYAEEESALIMQFVKEGGVVVEAGANMGCHTVAIARKVGNAGRVFAFEPQRIIYQMLCGNLSINGLWNVIAERAALGDKQTVL